MQFSKLVVAALAATLAVILMTAAVSAGGGEVTRGDFEPFAAGVGTYDDISGGAQMVRTASGKTIVSVTVKGLRPFRVRVFPTGFSVPKYFLATDSVSTIELGSVNAVPGSPYFIGKDNIVRKEGSTT